MGLRRVTNEGALPQRVSVSYGVTVLRCYSVKVLKCYSITVLRSQCGEDVHCSRVNISRVSTEYFRLNLFICTEFN